MASVVVDTDVVSFLLRGDSRGPLYQPHLDGHSLVISFMTLAELRPWAVTHQWGPRRRMALDVYLQRVAVRHSDAALCQRWAEVMAASARSGRVMDGADAWQAAVALHYGIPLVTHNRRHYAPVSGLQIISHAP